MITRHDKPGFLAATPEELDQEEADLAEHMLDLLKKNWGPIGAKRVLAKLCAKAIEYYPISIGLIVEQIESEVVDDVLVEPRLEAKYTWEYKEDEDEEEIL